MPPNHRLAVFYFLIFAATIVIKSRKIKKEMEPDFIPMTNSFQDADGHPDGGISTGIGFTIAWQRGTLDKGRNGAFILEVLGECLKQLSMYNSGAFACGENQAAIANIELAIRALEDRRKRRESEGSLGTHIPDARNE